MICLVTGGWGYIGSRIVRNLLDKGVEVVVADASEINAAARQIIGEEGLQKIKFWRIDIADPLQVFAMVGDLKITHIIHTAFVMGAIDSGRSAKAGKAFSLHPGKVMTGELDLGKSLRVNCFGMLNILEAARMFEIKRVTYTSAYAAFGTAIADIHPGPIPDEGLFAPDTMYAATKITNELMARIIRDRYGIETVGLRFGRTYGVGGPGGFPQLIRRVALGEPVELADPTYFNSYTYVDDCADAHVYIAMSSAPCQSVYNVREQEYTNLDLVNAIKRVHPDASIRITDAKGDGVRVPHVETSGIFRDTGWKAKVNLETGLRQMMNHWRAEARLPELAPS
ncbi:SDR family NAD(P)-dependent oxidoreductase [Bosea caraganae]|uniref:SDR family NAD(P)-dependent oxidoreductase n=1 Tax=Bosea caraganae TaxID=2763117 RepID=A0A370KZ77_9HYPH|nr:SDR family NAD(P)-dependent oxidoreductase [Bosea caraganae]RDJ20309.1 SDR family NAD(P)-dependent oxidoreductase [Bosea caraganae]RDJ24005.1 SDR family NAD(P)-dependent oxidoreductase [Bosea caraganae]